MGSGSSGNRCNHHECKPKKYVEKWKQRLISARSIKFGEISQHEPKQKKPASSSSESYSMVLRKSISVLHRKSIERENKNRTKNEDGRYM